METKRLTKSDDNRVLCGVCGGIGEYFNIDPVVMGGVLLSGRFRNHCLYHRSDHYSQ